MLTIKNIYTLTSVYLRSLRVLVQPNELEKRAATRQCNECTKSSQWIGFSLHRPIHIFFHIRHRLISQQLCAFCLWSEMDSKLQKNVTFPWKFFSHVSKELKHNDERWWWCILWVPSSPLRHFWKSLKKVI